MALGLSEVFDSKTSKVYKDKRLNNAHFSDFNHNDYGSLNILLSNV